MRRKLKFNFSLKNVPIKGMRINNIRMKLIGAFAIPVLLIVLLGVVSYGRAADGIIHSYESANLASLDMLSDYYGLALESITAKAMQINTNDAVKNYFNGYYQDDELEEAIRFKDAQRLVNSTAIADKIVRNVFVFGEYGDGISSTGPLKKSTYQAFLDSEEGKRLSELGVDSYWSGYHKFFDELSSIKETDYGLVLYRNLYNSANDDIGYIVFDIRMEFITDALEKVNFEEKSIVGLVTEDGREIIGGEYPEGFTFKEQDFLKTSVESQEDSGSNYVNIGGQSYLLNYSKIIGGNAILFTMLPEEVIVGQAQTVKIATVIMVVIASIVAIIIATIISSGFSGAINGANLVLAEAANGNLTVNAKTRRKDEFLKLTNSINNMTQSMKKLILGMTDVSGAVAKSAGEVTDSTNILFSATEQISSAVNDINQGITQQAGDAEQCLIQMEDLSKQINSLNQNTSKMNEIASVTKSAVGNVTIMVDELNSKSKDTVDITMDIIEDVEHLEESSSSINSIVETMNTIAKQTNLLSLNASIEAARSGEAGKGFAVVATEIRNLAEQSAEAANQIGDIIKNMQEYIIKTVATAKKANGIVGSQETALNSTIEVFNEINQHVENLTRSLDNVSEEIDRIDKAKNTTLGAIESISATSEETAAASNQLETTAEQQLDAVKVLRQAATELKSDANDLEQSVAVFKVD